MLEMGAAELIRRLAYALAIGLLIGLVVVGGSYWFSDRLAIRAAGAIEVTEAEAPELVATVRELDGRAGLPMPRVYLAPAPQPNAFATGRNPAHAAGPSGRRTTAASSPVSAPTRTPSVGAGRSSPARTPSVPS